MNGVTSLDLFRSMLDSLGYEGELSADIAARSVAATDNSIYQVTPFAVLYPRVTSDINLIVHAAREVGVPLAARGGGTGTNGQSLTTGVIVDVSRHLNKIISFDAEAGIVTVEPGVVLDQLNDFLAGYNLFFAPMVSTASRATIAGMVATDASGKGSRVYGKTSAHVAALDVVLSDGSDWSVHPLDPAQLEAAKLRDGIVGEIHREVSRIITEHSDLIARTFPKIDRGLTGYNLAEVVRPDGRFFLAYLLAGSEGTLAFTKSVTLRVLPRPRRRALLVVRYGSFDAALRNTLVLMPADPTAIEVVDDKLLALAKRHVMWTGLEGVLGGPASQPVNGLNFIEFVGDDESLIERKARHAVSLLEQSPFPAIDWTLVKQPSVIAQLWSLREAAVGLMGELGGNRQGTSFVEDAAVTPEQLADFIGEFREILDRHNLSYGMYGHADVGCLHVRPALDMRDPEDAGVIRPVTEEVAALAKRYGGLLWGEHGRGYRGEFSPLFFGPLLYAELGRIKRAFDPANLFNPGKLAAPATSYQIDRIDAVPMKGQADRHIDAVRAQTFDRAIACNGNGACHSWDVFAPMCPSFKATRDRVQSPKGRATLLRKWAAAASQHDRGTCGVGVELAALEIEVMQSLDTCLSCKACSSTCPVKVDIPTMRSHFLSEYHRRHRRPLRHHAVARLETFLPVARRFPRTVNAVLALPATSSLIRKAFGLVDLPAIVPARTRRHPIPARPTETGVVLLQDSFLSSFDGTVIDAATTLLERCGYQVHVSEVWANGKAQHVIGMNRSFKKVARRAQAKRAKLSAYGLPLLSLDAATGLLFEQEYQEFAPARDLPPVLSIEEFLVQEIDANRIVPHPVAHEEHFSVLLHCTERTARPEVADKWRRILAQFGITADVPSAGCCGMAGMFGHEAEHAELSFQIFDLGWRPRLDPVRFGMTLATGFSCRCQTKRRLGFRPLHPLEAILAHIEKAPAS